MSNQTSKQVRPERMQSRIRAANANSHLRVESDGFASELVEALLPDDVPGEDHDGSK